MKTLMIHGAIARAIAYNGMVFSPHADTQVLTPVATPQPVHRPCLEGEHGATGLSSMDPDAKIARSPDTGHHSGIVEEHSVADTAKLISSDDALVQAEIDPAGSQDAHV